MTAPKDLDRMVHQFLLEGGDRLDDAVYDEVRAEIGHRRQRAVIGPWRMPIMKNLLPIGLSAAAVVAVVVVGAQMLPRTEGPGGAVGATTAPSTAATAVPTASPSAWTGIPEGPFVLTSASDPVRVTVTIATPGWTGMPAFDAVSKADDSLDPPQTVGVALLAWGFPAGTGFYVYGDPCAWSTTTPTTPATTPDEIATALAAQASRDASAPVDVTIGGYAGKAITLHVPMSYEVAGASREEEFAACDRSTFGMYQVDGETEPNRNNQGPGQIDELWILDVNGEIVIFDAMHGPAVPAELVEEMRALVESATLE